jgi:two-component system, OmpR family, sensor histidine kinase CiaH
MFTKARWRIVMWNMVVVILLLFIIGAVVYGFFANNIYQGVDQLLQDRQARLLDTTAPNPQGMPELSAYDAYRLQPKLDESEYPTVVTDTNGNEIFSTTCFIIYSTFGTICPTSARTAFDVDAVHEAVKKGETTSIVVRNGEPERVLTFVAQGPPGVLPQVVQVAHSVSGEENALQELRTLLLLGGLIGVLFAGGSGLFLANLSLVPIREAFVRQRQFTADASHELRTPLALIRANAEMLGRSHHLRPEDSELADEIIGETDHLNRLVSDLLTLARADTGALQLVAKPVDLRSLVADVHEDVQLIAEERGIASTLSLNGPVTVAGDEGRLRQLLLILLDNAIKYTDAGGQVNVALQRAENRARLVISDTGIGIPKTDLGHIFERFYRVDRAREHESGGTGLGLSIASWIVQAHHGTIRADSDVGVGSKFQVDLPLGNGKPAEHRA